MEQPTATVQPSLLHAHFDHSVDGQYVLDPEADVFIKVNPALCELLGFTREQLVEAQRPVSTLSIVHEEDRELVRAQRAGAQNAGDSGVMRFRAVRSDGEVRHLEVRFSLISHMGRILQVGSARDVSEQVKLEHKLRTESDFNRELTLAAQRAAKDAQRKSLEVLEANTRVGALAEVLRAIPVLTKKLLELEQINDVFKETALTMVNDAQFSSCTILLKNEFDELEIKYANPFRMTQKLRPDDNPMYQSVLRGVTPLAVDQTGTHVAPIRAGGSVRGLLQVGLPKNLQRFFATHKPIQESIKDLLITIADFLGVVIENHENLERIKQQSRTDRLTGLYNRRVFDEQLVVEFRRALRYDRDLSLMILDIDNFKKINDTWLHEQGDEVLRAVSGLLKVSFRDLDTVCRYGGEEMVVIMPETVGDAARAKGEQIRRKISEIEIPLLQNPEQKISVTVSIGIACMNKATVMEDQLLRAADRALYYCKHNGKNQVKLADELDDA
ncbi:MAG: GGDEF domain-containing protein [Planctomycetes bacterium]|jgi:diguanylate cyclase (GGDEF)-like protein/PAS domain S-box-containing protein|nr:GGDEF domain-containing protein [Planctomycetota bacterium]MCL4730601.1 sensor domain-containing diguanylate cyclase [Planctomycetota bacterium]